MFIIYMQMHIYVTYLCVYIACDFNWLCNIYQNIDLCKTNIHITNGLWREHLGLLTLSSSLFQV